MESIMQTGMKREEKVDKQLELRREDEHLALLKWIDENQDTDFPFMLITKDEYDTFIQADDEDYIMDRQVIEGDEFYIKFKEITGVQLLYLDEFISMSYIDEARNDIELVVNINKDNKRFIIGV